jgi:hypothetical protein
MALSAASAVNRLRLVETLFSIFDLDTNGKISKDEMGKMLQTLVEVTNSNRKHHHYHHHHHHHSNEHDKPKEINLQKRIDEAFNELNTNDDDFITKDEFIEWYIKSGLLSDVKSNEINVPDTSRIQQLDKKSRKIKKQQLNTNNKEENHHSRPQFIRYMSHMSEQKSIPIIYNNDNEIINDNPIACQKRNSDDNDSHYSKENERWQHLFNSVLGQIRAQRRQEMENQQQQEINPNDYNRKSHFNSWKQQGEEKLKLEYYRQKTNDYIASPDIITIRL